MFSKIAEYITDTQTELGQLTSQDEQEINKYGLEGAISLVANVAMTILISVLLGRHINTIIFMLSLMSLRNYVGGYHSKTQLRCIIFSSCFTFISLSLIQVMQYYDKRLQNILLLFIGSIIMLFLAPVEHVNKQLDSVEKQVFRKRAIRTIFIINVFGCLFSFTTLRLYSYAISVAVINSAVLSIIGYILFKRSTKDS